MFFGKDQPESEGSRYAHPGIKSPPDRTPITVCVRILLVTLCGELHGELCVGVDHILDSTMPNPKPKLRTSGSAQWQTTEYCRLVARVSAGPGRWSSATWFKVLWESTESASYNGAFTALKASFGKAKKRAPNLLGPRLELLSHGHRPVESGNQTSQNPPDHFMV